MKTKIKPLRTGSVYSRVFFEDTAYIGCDSDIIVGLTIKQDINNFITTTIGMGDNHNGDFAWSLDLFILEGEDLRLIAQMFNKAAFTLDSIIPEDEKMDN